MLERLQTQLKLQMLYYHNRDKAIKVIKVYGADVKETIEFVIPLFWWSIKYDRPSRQNISGFIGKNLSNKWKLPVDEELDIRLGAKFLELFIDCGLVKLDLEKSTKNSKDVTYICKFKDEDLWLQLEFDKLPNPILTEPSLYQANDWDSKNSHNFIRGKRIDDSYKSIPTDINFAVANKMQANAWEVNNPILEVQNYLFPEELNLHIFSYQKIIPKNKSQYDSKKGKKRETETILRLAHKYANDIFYHTYRADFRGRYYPDTYAFNEQSSDTARGLLLLANKKPLGKDGFKWLSYSAANNWGDDKLPLQSKWEWAFFRLEEMELYAEDPIKNLGWSKAENPWQFLAVCAEIINALDFESEGNNIEDYLCGLPVFIDGSCNGIQHIAALSKDEKMGKSVNLIRSDTFQDIYKEIAERVWIAIHNIITKIDIDTVNQFDSFYTNLKEVHGIYEKERDFKLDNDKIYHSLWPVYWSKLDSQAIRRKIVKRLVMTLGYGVTLMGMKEMVRDDTPDIVKDIEGLDYVDFGWAGQLGKLVYELSYDYLKGLRVVISVTHGIIDQLKVERKHFTWTVPYTGMVAKQAYIKPAKKRIRIVFRGKTELWNIISFKEGKLDLNKEATAIAPNFVHSLDAAHLSATALACPFPTVFIHDSFGCLPSDMTELFRISREQFVNLYKLDPLMMLLREYDLEHLMPERGNLDINCILESDYAFS